MIVFLLVNTPFFSNWGMEMLIGQLYNTDDTVREEAIDVLDEACEDEVGLVFNLALTLTLISPSPFNPLSFPFFSSSPSPSLPLPLPLSLSLSLSWFIMNTHLMILMIVYCY